MLRQCRGRNSNGKGCSRFIAEWDNHPVCFSCRDCSQDNPCDVCSVWDTCLWSKASAAKAKAVSKRANLCKVGVAVQQDGSSRDSSLPSSEGNEVPVANNSSVVGVEVPSSRALALTGPNLGAQSLEISTAGNGTGSSSQPSCQKAPDNCSGASRRRSRSPLEVSEHLAVVHDDRRHGSRARSRRSHRSRSGSTRLPRAYRVRSRGRSCRSTKSHRSSSLTSSAGSERSLGGSRAYSPRVHGSRARRSHSRRSRRDGTRSPRSKRSRCRSRQHRRSRSSRRPRSRHHGSRSYIREKSRSYSRSSHSRSSSRDTRMSRHVVNPRSQSLSNATSEFSGFSSLAAPTASQASAFPPLPSEHGAQPDMRSLLRQLLAEELNALSGSRKRPRSRSTSRERVTERSHTAPDPDPLDEQGTADVQVSVGDVSHRNSPTEDTVPNLNRVSSLNEEPEFQIRPLPGETIGSDEDDSDDHNQERLEEDETGNSEQSSESAQLPYIEALQSLRTRLGSHLCPETVQDEPKTGASALDFFDKKSKATVHPALPQSRLILEAVSKINSKLQGENPIPGSPLDSYPKGLGTNRFPSLYMKPKVFGQESYKISDPTLDIVPPPIDPSFREVLRQGASHPTSHVVQLQQLEGWEKLARAGIHISSHADMFLYGILSALNSSAPSQTDLAEVRRYLQALAQSHKHLFDVLVRLTSGPMLARRDAFLDKCALDSSVKSSLRVQPLESATLFGSKMPDVAKTYKEDLTRRSLQNAAVAHLPSKKQKKAAPKQEAVKLVVNASDSGQRQVLSKPVGSSKSSQGSSSYSKNKKKRKSKGAGSQK